MKRHAASPTAVLRVPGAMPVRFYFANRSPQRNALAARTVSGI